MVRPAQTQEWVLGLSWPYHGLVYGWVELGLGRGDLGVELGLLWIGVGVYLVGLGVEMGLP